MRKKISVKNYLKDSNGQIIIVLLLVMLIVLSIGLVVTQRSITDVSTSTQTEQASRAFSAAEAGLARSLVESGVGTAPIQSSIAETDLGNQAKADYKATENLPNKLDQLLEYPPLGKEEIAQFWFANPATPDFDPVYTKLNFGLYFGDANSGAQDKPAITLNIVTRNRTTGALNVIKRYYDSDSQRAINSKLFVGLNNTACSSNGVLADATTNATNSKFYCSTSVDISECTADPNCYPVLVRARLVYANLNHPIAIGPADNCTPQDTCYLPRQANIYSATGQAGQSIKRLQIFREKYVVPQYLDFAIFSVGDITKVGSAASP